MCQVSNVGGGWQNDFPTRWPTIMPGIAGGSGSLSVSRSEFDALKNEVLALRKLLEAAKEFDEQTGQPDCEVDEKVAFIKKIAEFVGVDMDKVFK